MNKDQNTPALYWAEQYAFEEKQFAARTVLLREGQQARNIYIVKQGCLRLWMNHNGAEITTQFFQEGRLVASLESFLSGQPSDFYLETIEASSIYILEQKKFESLLLEDPVFKEWFNQYILNRFIYYSKHLLSFLRDKPEDRYRKLIENSPHIIRRIPQHYIASYLGITPVSLSRIRNKLLKAAQK